MSDQWVISWDHNDREETVKLFVLSIIERFFVKGSSVYRLESLHAKWDCTTVDLMLLRLSSACDSRGKNIQTPIITQNCFSQYGTQRDASIIYFPHKHTKHYKLWITGKNEIQSFVIIHYTQAPRTARSQSRDDQKSWGKMGFHAQISIGLACEVKS